MEFWLIFQKIGERFRRNQRLQLLNCVIMLSTLVILSILPILYNLYASLIDGTFMDKISIFWYGYYLMTMIYQIRIWCYVFYLELVKYELKVIEQMTSKTA